MEHSTVTVGLVQIGELNWEHRERHQHHVVGGVLRPKMKDAPTSGSFVYLPYSVGLLQAYAESALADPDEFEFLEPIYSRLRVDEIVAHLAGADIVGFSAYVWNIELSLAAARALKLHSPECVVVFGGPQVPDSAEAFLRANPFVDVVCHGEGERVFTAILAAARSRDWSEIPGVSCLTDAGTFVSVARDQRARDLSAYPSPYLAGTFDALMERHADHAWLALWETNRGCPYSCAFCDWGSATAARVNRFEMERLEAEAEWFARKGLTHVFVCDANFGILPRDVELARRLVDSYEHIGGRLAVSIQTTKSVTDRSYTIQSILSGSSAVSFGATLSLQSLDETTLDNVARSNISLEVFRERQQRYAADGVSTYTDLILGMPGETYDSFTNGIAKVIAEGQHNRVAFYNCSLLPNAAMGAADYQARHGIVSVPIRIVHEHQSLESVEAVEVPEYLRTVVATASMPSQDWVRARVFADLTALLHFDRVLQVPFVIAALEHGISYRTLIEAFAAADAARWPICAGVVDGIRDNARSIQRGEPEYVASAELLDLWWPADQHALVCLVASCTLDRFYDEAKGILAAVLLHCRRDADVGSVLEAADLNRAMLRVPNEYEDLELTVEHTVLEAYRAAVAGLPARVARRTCTYQIDRTSTVWLSWRRWAVDVTSQTYTPEAFLYPAKTLGAPMPATPVLSGA